MWQRLGPWWGGEQARVVVSLQSYTRSAAFIVTLHPLQSTTPDFWRLVYDYGCTSIVMLNQLHQSNSAWVRPRGLGALAACLCVFRGHILKVRGWISALPSVG